MSEFIVLFNNTRSVIKAEKILNNEEIYNKVIPVPKKYSSDCGMCLEIRQDNKEKVLEVLKENSVEFHCPVKDSIKLTTLVNKGGCSAKLDPVKLENLLKGTVKNFNPNLIIGSDSHDDGGVYRMANGKCLIQTLDFFPPVVDDPFEFGQVAAANALSDVYAMGGTPLTVMNIVQFPAEKLDMDILREIISGGNEKIRESGAAIAGGHTIENAVPVYGCSVTGIVEEDEIVSNKGAESGDILVLTKSLGTGMVLSADKIGLEGEYDTMEAINSMKRLNNIPVKYFKSANIKGGTDVTGFGLFGHGYRVASESGVSLRIFIDKLPIFKGIHDLINQGCIPGGAMRNKDFTRGHVNLSNENAKRLQWIGFDPQTSGGLLLSVPADKLDSFMESLKNDGENPVIIGEVIPKSDYYIECV